MTQPPHRSGDEANERLDPQNYPEQTSADHKQTTTHEDDTTSAAPPNGKRANDHAADSVRDDDHDDMTPAAPHDSTTSDEVERPRDDHTTSAATDSDELAAAADADTGTRRPRMALIISTIFILAAVGIGLGVFFSQRSAHVDLNQVIARVGDAEITRGDFLRQYRAGQDPQQTLDDLIQIELIVQAAQREGATVDKAQIDEQINQIRTQAPDDEAFNQLLAQEFIDSEEGLRTILSRQQLVEAMLFAHTTLEQARSRHILLSTEDPETADDRKAEADEILDQIEDGADFAILAKAKSEDPGTKEDGGDLGWAPRDFFVPEFNDAIFSMQPGDVRLVQSSFGWHIIELLEGPEVRQLEDSMHLQTPAGQQALEETFLPWAESLRDQADQANQITILVPAANLEPTPAQIQAVTPQP
ncbi:MAG: peptidylprolyl isomerase [Chloroflexales bacterium]|nr:peptidylprolyl isomerase [Chloroflexales bacterium]